MTDPGPPLGKRPLALALVLLIKLLFLGFAVYYLGPSLLSLSDSWQYAASAFIIICALALLILGPRVIR
jgi:Co/Zn/Cd efflux system component